jgi:hypothetical protein
MKRLVLGLVLLLSCVLADTAVYTAGANTVAVTASNLVISSVTAVTTLTNGVTVNNLDDGITLVNGVTVNNLDDGVTVNNAPVIRTLSTATHTALVATINTADSGRLLLSSTPARKYLIIHNQSAATGSYLVFAADSAITSANYTGTLYLEPLGTLTMEPNAMWTGAISAMENGNSSQVTLSIVEFN